ncbi:peptidoglycan DD-metalloendopeptidase family protein [Candidatus Woesebacteria bacterium]|nr:peptidoglycan DD-metalloendopeptidase family protein [Candidatus Woesebacteria bacterium]
MSSRYISALILLFALFLIPKTADALVCSGAEDCQKKIKEYESKLGQAKADKTSLASQLQLINTKVSLAQARLTKTEADIEVTTSEIDELGHKIDNLNASLDHLTQVLLQKIVEGYKRKNASVFEILFSEDANTLANQMKYIHVAQENDRVLAIRTQQVKVNYSEQKDLREEKISQLEELKSQLEVQKVELNNQMNQKAVLLEQTKSDEVKYQQLLSQAMSEFQAIEKATITGQKIGKVKKGDAIALVGNTGFPYCSTGAHLHFEVRKGGSWTDPGGYVGKDWQMPLAEPVTMTQGYGVTPYSWRYSYSGGIHTGWDMVSGSSSVIRAVADGELYSSSQNCSGAIIKIKYIEHGGGLISYYLHVQ